jgi:hypothetical protein
MIKILYILPAILLAVQALDDISSGYLSSARGGLLVLMVLIFLLRYKPHLDLVGKVIIIFLGYTFFLTFGSTNYLRTLLSYTSIFVSFSFYIIAYTTMTGYSHFKKFKILFWIVPLIYIFSAVIFSVFNLDAPIYGESQTVHMGSGLHHNTIYTGVLIISLYFVLIKESDNKLRDTILISVMAILILLSFRRTAIILLMVSYILFITMSKKQHLFKYVMPSIILMIITYPLYDEHVDRFFEARGSRATFEHGIQSESRFIEMRVINEKILNSEDLKYFFFGMEFLNSQGTYFSWRFPVPFSRPLHSDYSVVLHGSGIVGILLYFFLLVSILYKLIRYVKLYGLKNDVSIMLTVLTFILILVTFSGSILSITFRTSLFLFIGSLMRIADNAILSDTYRQKNSFHRVRVAIKNEK